MGTYEKPSLLFLLLVLAFVSTFEVCSGATYIEICGGWNGNTFQECKSPKDVKPNDKADAAWTADYDQAGAPPQSGGNGSMIGFTQDYHGPLPSGWTQNSDGTQSPPQSAGPAVTHYYSNLNCGAPGGGSLVTDTTGTPNGQGYVDYVNNCNHAGSFPNIYTYLTGQTGATVSYCQRSGQGACGTVSGSFTFQSEARCPNGYGSVNGDCHLNNEAAVMKPSDAKCSVIRSGNIITMDPKDPDCNTGSNPSTVAGAVVHTVAAGNAAGASYGGQSLSVVVDSASGNVTITSSEVTATGDTAYNRLFVGGSGANKGVVTGTTSGVTAGSGSGNDPEATVPKTDASVNETGTPTGVGYNAAGKAALDAMTPSTFGKGNWSGDLHAIPNGMPGMVGSDSCENPMAFHIYGVTITPDICSVWGPLKGGFSWLLYVLTALYMFRRVQRVVGA